MVDSNVLTAFPSWVVSTPFAAAAAVWSAAHALATLVVALANWVIDVDDVSPFMPVIAD
jgi:hypothetical protein